MKTSRLLLAFVLPFFATIVVPLGVLLKTSDALLDGSLPPPDRVPFPILGVVYLAIGMLLFWKTVGQFASHGGGTLAPWDPPRALVVTGIYRYVRNPMISGVLFILLGEATFFGSKPLLYWFLTFLAINMIYVPTIEERRLEARFGEDYRTYKENVPRWIPRLKPWEPGGE